MRTSISVLAALLLIAGGSSASNDAQGEEGNQTYAVAISLHMQGRPQTRANARIREGQRFWMTTSDSAPRCEAEFAVTSVDQSTISLEGTMRYNHGGHVRDVTTQARPFLMIFSRTAPAEIVTPQRNQQCALALKVSDAPMLARRNTEN